MDIQTIAEELRTEIATTLKIPYENVGIVVTHRLSGNNVLELHLSGKVFVQPFDNHQFRLNLPKFRQAVLKPLLKQLS